MFSHQDELVRQFVFVDRAGWKVFGQYLAADSNGLQEALDRLALLYFLDHRLHRPVPDFRRDLGVDAGVGNDLYMTLGDRGEDEHAGALFHEMQAVRGELPFGLDTRAVAPDPSRNQGKSQAGQRKEDRTA